MAKHRTIEKVSQPGRGQTFSARPAALKQTMVTVPRWFSLLAQKWNGGLLAVLLFSAVGAVFFPSLSDGFVAWDDDHTFYTNPHIQGLDAERLHWMFTDSAYAMRYKPLSWLAYALIFQVNGMNPFGFHLAGLLFHCGNAVLIFLVLRRLFKIGFGGEKPGALQDLISVSAAWGVLLWAVHPLRVEPVARATDITYGQTLFFTLISLWCYLRAVERGKGGRKETRWYAGAVGAFAVAMLSYPFVLGYPVVLAVLDVYPLRRFHDGPGWWRDRTARRIWLEKLPFVLLSGIVLLTFYGRLHPIDMFADTVAASPISPLGRAMQAFYVWGYYFWKPWAPFHLSPVYTTLVNFEPWTPMFVASAIGVLGLTGLLIWKRREWPLALALWICHLALLIPALGLTEHPHYASDRYSYVAGILWAALIAAGCVSYGRRHRAMPVLGAVSVVALALCVLSIGQIRIWQDTPTLFKYMIGELGNDPYREYIQMRLGVWYVNQNQPDEAIKQFEAMVEANPSSVNAQGTLGGALVVAGRTGEGVGHLREAVRLAPAEVKIRRDLAFALMNQGQMDEAVSQCQEALQVASDDADSLQLLGVILCKGGRFEEAIPAFQAAIKNRPNSPVAHNGLGMALCKLGRTDEAIGHFRTALELKPDYNDARDNLNAVLRKKSGP